MSIKVAINGFGRIGRLALRAGLEMEDLEFVGINHPGRAPELMAYMFKYDSAQGIYPGEVTYDSSSITVNGKRIPLFSCSTPKEIPWASVGAEYVIESSGKFLTKEEAEEHEANGIPCIEDAGRGYRAVVPSPMPVAIKELKTIKTLLDNDHIVITCGGGGIPVVNENGKLVGTNAVIDKDNVSSLLATKLDADFLVILTAVEKVAINFGKPNQKWISEMSVDEAKQYINEGQFAKGSMLPKVEAAVSFVQSGNNKKALITLLEKAADGIAGKTGTVIHL